MAEQQAAMPSRKAVIAGNTDTSLLKIIALVAMIFDHIGVAFLPDVMELRMVGRIALPLYAWCLVVGSEYTRNAFKYALRLFVLAVISQPFNMMALSNSWSELNILFLLCLGVLAIAGMKEKWYYSQFWAPALCFLVLLVFDVDYGWRGLLFILVLYGARKTKSGLAAAFLAYALLWGTSSYSVSSIFGWEILCLQSDILKPMLQYFFRLQAMIWLALPLILIQTHSNIRMPQWLGYGLYPLHLIALILVGLLIGIPLYQITSILTVF